jgi:spore coat protein A
VILTRRQFLQHAGAMAASRGAASLNPDFLPQFVDPLPVPEIAKSLGLRPPPGSGEPVPFFRIPMRQVACKLHRDLPATRLWCYGSSWPGRTIEVRKGHGVLIEWPNDLPQQHFLPIDHSLHGADRDKPQVRTIVHVHGAKVPPESDGYPENWYVPGQSATFLYPNEQDATLLWYHDHAMGINRLNIYAGLMGLYVVRDEAEDALNLPNGEFEVPLVFCDRFLRKNGQLDYPVSGKADAPWVAEVFGNVMTVNGKMTPYLEVQPRKYRFRMLNGANGRFFHLSLSNGQEMHQIGSDQGLLAASAAMKALMMAPGERVDVVMDFRDHAGERIVLKNDAFEMMQFRVGREKVVDDSSLPKSLRPVARIPESSAVRTRILTIDEFMDKAGETTSMLLNNSHWDMPVTENPTLDTVEIWTIVNPTEDSHPIHLHLVRMQLLDRANYDRLAFHRDGQLRLTGPRIAPETGEAGWKDTVRADPKMVTRLIIPFEGYTGRYVWHCHILEHEDNEMMRPYEVLPPATKTGSTRTGWSGQ